MLLVVVVLKVEMRRRVRRKKEQQVVQVEKNVPTVLVQMKLDSKQLDFNDYE
jgi:hypothetical protein